jgi:hypothetical protein
MPIVGVVSRTAGRRPTGMVAEMEFISPVFYSNQDGNHDSESLQSKVMRPLSHLKRSTSIRSLPS